MTNFEPQEVPKTPKKLSRRSLLKGAAYITTTGAIAAATAAAFQKRDEEIYTQGQIDARSTDMPKIQKAIEIAQTAVSNEQNEKSIEVAKTAVAGWESAQKQTEQVSAEATHTAFDLAQARVSATEEALNNNPDAKNQLWNELPDFAKTRSVSFTHYFLNLDTEKKTETGDLSYSLSASRDSGTIMGKKENKLIIVTAKHSFELDPIKNETYNMKINISGSERTFFSDVIEKYPSPSVDFGIIAITTPQDYGDHRPIHIGNIPTVGETLYCVSFPGTLDHKNDPFPQKFQVTRANSTEVVVDSVTSGGASGSGVYNIKGEFVGVITAVGSEGVYIVPAKPYYERLLKEIR